MAFESRYWRPQIKRDINFLFKKIAVNVTNLATDDIDERFSQIETKLFTITYALRKLMDTRKFLDAVSEKNIKVRQYPRNKKSFRAFGSFDDYYEFGSRRKIINLGLREICNQFTHAHFFQLIPNSTGIFRTIFFVSDRDKNKYLYSLDIRYFLNQILKIINKYPLRINAMFNETKNKWSITCK